MMPKNNTPLPAAFIPTPHGFECVGSWSVLQLNAVLSPLPKALLPSKKKITLDGTHLTTLDSAGAIALLTYMTQLSSQCCTLTLQNFSTVHRSLLDLIQTKLPQLSLPVAPVESFNFLAFIGKETIYKLNQAKAFIVLLGDLTTHFLQALVRWKHFQFPSIVSNINSAGLQALPILALLSFLIGVVLAYQMGLQLKTYGANIFIAYLSGMAIFREFGPLIAAIIVSGRTSSAFTAQIGSMIVNEEVDAICAMGLSPVELLVTPKVISLLIFFPILIFWSDAFSILGAMLMSKAVLSVDYQDFLARLQETVGHHQFMAGLYKAPTFALITALVGCFQGFRVQHRTDSIGAHTTKSVVQALFLIIVADAIYSVVYNWLDI